MTDIINYDNGCQLTFDCKIKFGANNSERRT